MSLVGSKFGKYEITRLLGEGGKREVCATYDSDSGRTAPLRSPS